MSEPLVVIPQESGELYGGDALAYRTPASEE